jgi:transposase
MARPRISDELWCELQPLLPAPRPRRARSPGRRPLEPRKVLTGILFVLKTGIPWTDLPAEMGCGCGMSCLNYLRDWLQAGVWPRLAAVLQARLPDADCYDWARAADASVARGAAAACYICQATNPPAGGTISDGAAPSARRRRSRGGAAPGRP